MSALHIRGLRAWFGSRPVLDGLDLDIEARRITVLLGLSGCGKTTFLRCLNRLNDEFPGSRVEGTIEARFDDGPLPVHAREADVAGIRRRIGMIFQHPNPLPTSIRRNLALPLELTTALDAAGRAARIEASLRTTGLWDEVHDRLDAPASTLSGGQQQRLCLARTLALDPEIVLADEPTASLDFRAARGIEGVLQALARRLTVVMVTHDPLQAHRLADRVLLMRDGRIAADLHREGFGAVEAFRAKVEGVLGSEG